MWLDSSWKIIFILLLFIPFINFLIIFFNYNKLNIVLIKKKTTSSLLWSFFICIFCLFFFKLFYNSPIILDYSVWLYIDSFSITWKFLLDTVSLSFLSLVFFITTLILQFSKGYMSLETKRNALIFYFFLYLFAISMSFIISAGNLFVLFVGWELVGVTSFLLINFWSYRIEANKAALKAIILNKVGDMSLYSSLFFFFYLYNNCDFIFLKELLFFFELHFNFNFQILAGFFLFLAAISKSAQLGFHTWLPDAMEGPTPVSALLHAATMVTAGVFLVLRLNFFFIELPQILFLFSIFGAFSSFFFSIYSCFSFDIKKILAFSTISQLGVMFFSCGLGFFTGAFFHLFVHAFYKALLFLTSGLIIHQHNGEQDIRKMGFLFRRSPFVFLLFFIGGFSLMGLPFSSGFYSKEFIFFFFENRLDSFFLTFFSFCLWQTSFLMFFCFFKIWYYVFKKRNNYSRIFFKTFPINKNMLFSLVILAFCSLMIGPFGLDFFLGPISFYFFEWFSFDFYMNVVPFSILFLHSKAVTILAFFYIFFRRMYRYKIWKRKYRFSFLFQFKVFLPLYNFFKKNIWDNVFNNYFSWPCLQASYNVFLSNLEKGFFFFFGPFGFLFKLLQTFLFFNLWQNKSFFLFIVSCLLYLILFSNFFFFSFFFLFFKFVIKKRNLENKIKLLC